MDNIESIVKEKLISYGLPPFEQLEIKTKNRLIQIETFIAKSSDKMRELIEEAKGLKITKAGVANAEDVSFTRKTIYNDALLNDYLEKSIENQEDFFNERKIEKLQLEIEEVKKQNDTIINNIIYTNNLELQIKSIKKELEILQNKNEELALVINDKNKEITLLGKRIKF